MVRDELPVTIIVGGGIGGLYSAYQLGRAGYPVTVLEQAPRWGGRIESIKMPPGRDEQFIAEFGPMRFEPGLQERLVLLARHLGIGFTHFAPTAAPISPTDYEVSDVEGSFSSTADLLLWAVLNMFFGEPVRQEAGESAASMDGPAQLNALRVYLDKHFDADYDAVQAWLDGLRQHQRLEGRIDEEAPLLREIGLWNALSEVVTPGGLAKIRDSGTFYHFIAHNPSAVEWGIFWLRQAATKGASIETFDSESAPDGVASLVGQLVERITAECPSVHLRLNQRVLEIAHAKRPGEVEVSIEDETGATFSLRADHVILALPQSAARRLASNFPAEVQRALESVLPLPMLKAFLVTSKPWWSHHVEAQSHAWLVPTRELHYYTLPRDPACKGMPGSCTCGPVSLGMVMLYTDVPAIEYWRPFIPGEEQASAGLFAPDDPAAAALKRALVRQLLVEANPNIADKIDMQRRRVEYELMERLDALGARLCEVARTSGQALSAVLREYALDAIDSDRDDLEAVFRHLFGGDESWIEELTDPGRVTRPKEERIAEYEKTVVAFGIHDWSRQPFGGAAHCWRPGTDSVQLRALLSGFGLRGRPEDENIHVCGEAYSDFQGFIEGALHTAEQVCRLIAPGINLELPPSERS